MLLEVPGGEIVVYYSAYWPTLDMTMDVPNDYARSVGTCATGSICAFTGASLGGTKLTWGTRITSTVPAEFGPKSLANARGPGSVAQAEPVPPS